jgi:hypothetical protein
MSVTPFMPKRVVPALPPPICCGPGRCTTFHKLLRVNGHSACSALVGSRSSCVAAAGCHGLRGKLAPLMPGKVVMVAPLAQWLHHRGMQLGKGLVDLATRAPPGLRKQSDSVLIVRPMCGDITSRCSGTGNDQVHARHCSANIKFSVRAPQVRRPPAELGRYTAL